MSRSAGKQVSLEEFKCKKLKQNQCS